MIVEVSMRVRDRLLTDGRVYVEWNAFKVREFDRV